MQPKLSNYFWASERPWRAYQIQPNNNFNGHLVLIYWNRSIVHINKLILIQRLQHNTTHKDNVCNLEVLHQYIISTMHSGGNSRIGWPSQKPRRGCVTGQRTDTFYTFHYLCESKRFYQISLVYKTPLWQPHQHIRQRYMGSRPTGGETLCEIRSIVSPDLTLHYLLMLRLVNMGFGLIFDMELGTHTHIPPHTHTQIWPHSDIKTHTHIHSHTLSQSE